MKKKGGLFQIKQSCTISFCAEDGWISVTNESGIISKKKVDYLKNNTDFLAFMDDLAELLDMRPYQLGSQSKKVVIFGFC